MRQFGRKATATVVAAASVLLLGVVTGPAAQAATGRTLIQVEDRCEPESFNEFSQAEFGVDICFREGDVTFAKFIDKLNTDDGGHGAWRFSRKDTHIDHGQSLRIRNVGGEDHSFTEVRNFGTGVVPQLNAAITETDPAIPVDPAVLNFLPPGGSTTISGLEPGVHLFECLIHPWMRSVVEVRD